MVFGDNKKWIHSTDDILKNKVSYNVKFLGKIDVDKARGSEVTKCALQKLLFNKQRKRSEGIKLTKVSLVIGVEGITIIEVRNKQILEKVPLQVVSFCSDDKKDKRLFSFIARHPDNQHYCFGFESSNEASEITLSIGQSFDVAYQSFLQKKEKISSSKKMIELSKKVDELVLENSKLKQRICELEENATKKPGDESFENFQSNEQLKESKQPYVDSFDMKPFSSTFSLPSSQPSSQPPSQPSSQPSQPSSQPSQPSSQPLPSQLKYPLPKEMVSTAIRPRPRKSETDSISFENRTSESCKTSLPQSLLIFDPLHSSED